MAGRGQAKDERGSSPLAQRAKHSGQDARSRGLWRMLRGWHSKHALAGRRLIVHRSPVNGKFTSVVIYGEHESIAPLEAPNALFSAALALPKA